METADEVRAADKVHNILLVINEVVEGAAIRAALVNHLAGQQVRVMVVAPALVESGLDHEMGQVDEAMEPARERLDRSLDELRRVGIEAVGEVGDSDPILAISDELQKFPADEILLITHREEDQAYAEKGLLERAQHDFAVPITQLVVTKPSDLPPEEESPGDRAGEGVPHLVGVRHEPEGCGKDTADAEISPNFPPLRFRDIAAMVYGFLGTLTLFILAGASALGDSGSGVEGASAAKLLIAIGAFLFNAGHAVALIFFQSVRYEGIFERFASTATVVATTVALLVVLLI